MKIQIDAENPKPKRRITDDEYKFVFQRTPRLCLDFILVRDGAVLLAKREIDPWKDFFTLPGGMVRYKEPVDEAAERILYGELGLRPVAKRLVGQIEYLKDGPWLHSVSLAFVVTLEDGVLRGSDQAHEMHFFRSFTDETHPIQAKFLKQNWDAIIA